MLKYIKNNDDYYNNYDKLTMKITQFMISKNIFHDFRADCSAADKPNAIPEHNGLSPFGKVSL